jgi:hypothetical protein
MIDFLKYALSSLPILLLCLCVYNLFKRIEIESKRLDIVCFNLNKLKENRK